MSKAGYLICALSGVTLWIAVAVGLSLSSAAAVVIAPLTVFHLFAVPAWAISEGDITKLLRSFSSWLLIASWFGALAIFFGVHLSIFPTT